MEDQEFFLIAKAVSDSRRMSILEAIAKGKGASCQSLNEEFPISKATMSHHLSELTEAGLIEVERRGRYAFLSLRKDVWREYCGELKKRIR